MNKRENLKNQSGLVSILVTLIIMIVLSLIVIGFAKLVRRDQQQTLDRQLNTQALYAAESGINDVVRALESDPSLVSGGPYMTDCNQFIVAAGLDNDLDTSASISYTCALVDPRPSSLVYDDVRADKPIVVPVIASTSLSNIRVSWRNPDYITTNCTRSAADPNNLPTSSGWTSGCRNALLRVDIISGSNASHSSTAISSNTMTFFAWPRTNNGSSSVSFNPGNSGAKVNGRCGLPAPGECEINITGLSQSSYYLRITPLYITSDVTITAQAGAANEPLEGAQALIDVTGRATDILKRLQVRHSLVGHSTTPSFGLHSGSTICKDYAVIPSDASGFFPGSCTIN